MDKAYKLQFMAFLVFIISTNEVCCSRKMFPKRVTNIEVKLDIINDDIAAFRLDMLDIWDTLNTLNGSIMCLEKTVSSQTTEVVKSSPAMASQLTQQKPLVENDILQNIYRAFQSEKSYLHDNIDALKQGQENIENKVNIESENYKKSKDVLTKLNHSVTVFKNEQEKVIRNIEDRNSAQEKNISNTFTTIKSEQNNAKSLISGHENDIQNLVQKVKEIEKSYKEIIQNLMSQMNSMQKEMDIMKERNVCPQAWHVFKESCYFFGTSTLTWTEAKNVCKFQGAYLVEHNSLEEVYHLTKVLTSSGKWTQTLEYWTGGTDILKEGNWKWSYSGTTVNFYHWHPNQPDNHGNEDCMTSQPNADGLWNDLSCDHHQRYVCERAKMQ